MPATYSTTVDDDETKHLAGVTYQLKLIKCGKRRCGRCRRGPAHGPYWYAFWKSKNRTHCKYVGKRLPADVVAALAVAGRRRGFRRS